MTERHRRRPTRREAGIARAFTVSENDRDSLADDRLGIDSTRPIEIDLAGLRPKTRGECVLGLRPCPWAGCKHHLYLDVDPETGSIKINRPDIALEDLEDSCVLDVADRGEHTLEQVGTFLNITRERTRQLEAKALKRSTGAAFIAELRRAGGIA